MEGRKKLLIVTQHFWPEAFRVNDLAAGFIERGYEVDVLCGLPNYPKGEWFSGYRYTGPRRETHDGVNIIRAGEIRRKGNTGLRIFLNYVSWPVCAVANLWRLKGPYAAVLCYNTSPVLMNLPAILYAKTHRVPLTSYVLDIWPENLYSVLPVKNRLLRGVAHWVSDWHYRRCDRLIAMSESLRRRLCERTKKPESVVAVIPQHCEDFYAVPIHDEALAARFAGRFNLVFTGNFSPAQSLETVIKAAVKARRQGADALRLVLVGDGMSADALKTLAKELDAGGTVEFLPSVRPEQVPAYTALADALVASLSASPDLGMTVPAKIASYMAAAKPLLASMDGEGAAAVAEAGCGLVSAAEDVDALAANMAALCAASDEQRTEMGRRAFAYYETHYRRRAVLDRLEEFILRGNQE